MDNHKISDVTREKYEDAAIAVFMDQYAAALEAGIDQEMAACEDTEFPPELEKRCLELIQKEQTKKKWKVLSRQSLRALRNVAAVVVVLLGLCSVLFVTVEAFRLPIMNFFIEKTDSYWQLSGAPNTDKIPEVFNPEDPLDGIIPDDFLLADMKGAWGTACYAATYSNENGAAFSFEALASTGKSQIDSEDAQVTPTKLLGHDAKISSEGNTIQIAWLDENRSMIFKISAIYVSEETVLTCAETVAALLA